MSDDLRDDRSERQAVAAGSAATARIPWFRRPWALEAVGAVVVAFLLIGYALFSIVAGPKDELNDATAGRVEDVAIAVMKPTTAAAFDRTFVWQRVDRATSYLIVVSMPDGNRVFELRDLKVPSVKIDESVRLTPGRYVWQVTAFRDDAVLAESPLTEFTVP